MSEGMIMNVIVDNNINDENSEPNATGDNMDKEQRSEDFVPNEDTKDDEPWDREDEVFDDTKLTKWRPRWPQKRRIESIDINRNLYQCFCCNQQGHNKRAC